MRTNYVLIDFENVHVKSLDLIKDEHFRVFVFLGPKNTKLPVELVLAMQQFGTRGEYVVLETPGTNALDFHMAFHLGQLAAEDPSGFFHIISKDTGFEVETTGAGRSRRSDEVGDERQVSVQAEREVPANCCR